MSLLLSGIGTKCFLVRVEVNKVIISHLKSNIVSIERYDFSCEQTNWEWAMCSVCWIPNSFYDDHHLVLRGEPGHFPPCSDHEINIYLLGLCSRSKFDHILDVLNDEQGFVAYRGRTNTLINYDPVKRVWTMILVNDPDTFAVSRASLESLLMGIEGASDCPDWFTSMSRSVPRSCYASYRMP